MTLQTFNGGLRTRGAKHLFNVNEGAIFSNIDTTNSILEPLKSNVYYVPAKRDFYRFKNIFISFPTAYYVEQNNALYFTDGTTLKKWYGDYTSTLPYVYIMPDFGVTVSVDGVSALTDYGVLTMIEGDTVFEFDDYGEFQTSSDISGLIPDTSKFYNVGIVAPTTAPTLATTTGTLTGTYTYYYSYYDSARGVESRMSPSSEITVTAQGVSYSVTASTETQVDKIRIYRMGGTLPSPFLVAEKTNTTATYTDTAADNTLTDVANNTYNTTPPAGIKYIVYSFGVMFGAVDNLLYFSEVGFPDYWGDGTNFIRFDRTITGIGVIANGVLVFSKDKTWILTGTDKTSFSVHLVSGLVGCIEHRSIQYINNSLVWLCADGLAATNGGIVDIITYEKLGNLDYLANSSCVFDNCYYLSHAGGILVYDFRTMPHFRSIDIISNIQGFGVFDNKMFGSDGTNLYEMFVDDTNILQIHFKSGYLHDGNLTVEKNYDNIRFYYSGYGTIKAYVNGVLATEYEFGTDVEAASLDSLYGELVGSYFALDFGVVTHLSDGVKTYILDDYGIICNNLKYLPTRSDRMDKIQLPISQNKGYGIEFEIAGDCKIYTIDYGATSVQPK